MKVSGDASVDWEELYERNAKGCVVLYTPSAVLTALDGGQDSAEREQVSPGLVFALKLNSVWVGLPPTPGMHRGWVR